MSSPSAITLTSSTTIPDNLAQQGMHGWWVANGGIAILKGFLSQFQDNLDLPLTVGTSTDGHDVIFYGTTASTYLHWDKSLNKLATVGKVDVKFLGSTTTYYAEWDASANIWHTKGGADWRADGSVSTNYIMLDASQNTLTSYGKLDVTFTGSTAASGVRYDASANTWTTVGKADVKWLGSTASSYVQWDASANTLLTVGKPDVQFVMSGTSLDLEGSQDQFAVDASANLVKLLCYMKPSTVGASSATPAANQFAFYRNASGGLCVKWASQSGLYKYGSFATSSVAA